MSTPLPGHTELKELANPAAAGVVTVDAMFPNCDRWGAREWFQRLVTAVKNRDAAVVSGDDIAFETYMHMASATASRLARECATEILTALDTSASEPAGWRLVPEKPTEAMLDAMLSPNGLTIDGYPNPSSVPERYRAMLAAAPSLPSPGQAEPAVEVELPDDDEPKTWRDLAEAAIMDMRRYAYDKRPERRLVSVDAYTDRFALLDTSLSHPAPAQGGVEAICQILGELQNGFRDRDIEPTAQRIVDSLMGPRSADDSLLIYLKGCLSREDADGLIEVPADYIRRCLAALATPVAPTKAQRIAVHMPSKDRLKEQIAADGDYESEEAGTPVAPQSGGVEPVAYASEKALTDLHERKDQFHVNACLYRHPISEWTIPLYKSVALRASQQAAEKGGE